MQREKDRERKTIGGKDRKIARECDIENQIEQKV